MLWTECVSIDTCKIRAYTLIMDTEYTCICTSLRHAALSLTDLYDRVLAPSGLKITQFVILRDLILRQEPEKSITSLAQEEGLDRTTMGKNLRVLAREGMVAFAIGEDRRERVVRATEKGRKAFEQAIPLWEQAQTQTRQALGQEHVQTLLTLLTQIDEEHP
jgi:DNA-binding MarR family transcriptional regulator